MQIAHFLLAFFLSLLATSGPVMGAVASDTPSVSGSIFYFHYKSDFYRNQNASITILEEANLSPPIGSTPQAIKVAASIRNATTIFGSVWIGTIAWITRALAEPTGIHGLLTFSVWLSSNDRTPTFSGIGTGVAILNEKNQTVGGYHYDYSYARGKVLTSTPKEYKFQIELDQEIGAGQRLVFAVGVGSTTQGWQMIVYFDSTQYVSLVQIPSHLMVVAELANPTLLATIALIAMSLSFKQRKRIQQ